MGSRPQTVITGASAGIGAALAHRFAEGGHDLLLVARRAERLEALARELQSTGSTIETLPLDLMSEGAAAKVAAAAPAPDVLINNAGAGRFGPALDVERESQVRVVRLNCESLTDLTLAVGRGMVARGQGVVINLASIVGFQPVPYYAVYGASKAFVISLSEALDEEWGQQGVRVVAVCPGPVPTEFQEISGSPDAHETKKWALRTPEQIAEACWRAVARPQRLVIPAAGHGWMWWAQRFLPRGFVVGEVARQMRKRIEEQQ